jgi:hypothetical protein
MITLEAFINKKNIKELSKGNKNINPDDFRFKKPTKDDGIKFYNTLEENNLLPRPGDIVDGKTVIEFYIASCFLGLNPYQALFMTYESSAKRQVTELVMIFNIVDNDWSTILFSDKGPNKVIARDKSENKQLWNICDAIAKSLGFDKWDDTGCAWHN